jgi:hypothetical protein
MEPILESGKSLLDVVVYDAFVVRGLATGISFKDLLTMPLNEVLDSLGNKFPRRYFEPDPAASRDVRSLVAAVRSALPALSFTDDGALDENSCYVFIKDGVPQNGSGETGGLNCSGFAKWLVDGILSPLTGRRLSIAPLKTHTVEGPSSLTQNYADSRDSWFGLDWTRNLALEVWRAIRGPASATLRNIEVREAAFAALIDRQRGGAVRGYPGYLANAGFGIEGLRPLLYTLAVDQPGCIYLASVNVERGPAPRMRQHYHVAVLVPWFNEYGVFQTAVFESAAETSLARFMAQHPGAQVNLVRIPVEKRFQFQ